MVGCRSGHRNVSIRSGDIKPGGPQQAGYDICGRNIYVNLRIFGALFVPELLALVLVLRKSALIKNCIKKKGCRRRLMLCTQTRMSITIDDVMYVYTGHC